MAVWSCEFYLAFTLAIVPSIHSSLSSLCSRKLANDGFHREIETSLALPIDLMPDVIPDGDVVCYVMFVETLPSGAFVDPYQLKSLKPYGGPDVLISQEVDLEKPEFDSEAMTIQVYSDLAYENEAWTANYTLPIHLRYHAISDVAEYTKVSFKSPEVAIRCQIKEYGMQYFGYKGKIERQDQLLCGSDSKVLCDWTFIELERDNLVLTAQVPVGKKEHYLIVTIGTTLVTFIGCVLLIHKTAKSKTTKIS